MRLATRTASAVEEAGALDAVAAPISSGVSRFLPPGRTRDLLSGTPFGHPAHPAVVMVPLGLWTSGLVAGLTGDSRAAKRLTALGVGAALPAAATGLSDWVDTSGAERRVGLVHLASNSAALALFTGSWRARAKGRNGAANGLAVLGAVLASAGGWLGGHLAYSLGVGVDTNSFEGGPTEWQPVTGIRAEPAPGELAAGSVGGIGVVSTRIGTETVMLANRCSHRGGPLSDGEIDGACIRCPWHGSEFDLESGEVVRGPATVAQPVYEVRSTGEGLEARRDENRALRLNSLRPDRS